jgi:hypothetical protein
MDTEGDGLMEKKLTLLVQLEYDTYLVLEPDSRAYTLALELAKAPLYSRDWVEGEHIYTKRKNTVRVMIEPAIVCDELPSQAEA